MQLKRLEAYGFKSFADKTEIEFDSGITAIVGPNGSGKSNITDAVRWVLGEQNMRKLRGGKAEDIIFAGSATRKPLGVAEVSLLFDNTGELPVDFKEVLVTRRLYRSGDSEYYINRSRCRLKDIYNLFADTGIGHDGMSIIGQNRIDDILNSKPEDRRAFFEETAGITKYRNRKQETMRKLEDTEKNLQRVADILQVIEEQLEPLGKSAEKTRRYNAIQGEYQQVKVTDIHQKLMKFAEETAANQQAYQEAQDETVALEATVGNLEAEQAGINKEIIDLEKKMQAVAEESEAIRSELEALTGETATLTERQKQGEAAKERLLRERAELTAAQAAAEQEIAELTATEERQKQDLALADELLNEERQKAKQVEENIRRQRQLSREADKRRDTCQEALTAKQKELAVTERDLEAGSGGNSAREAEFSRQQAQLAALLAEKERLVAEEATENAKRQELETAAQELRQREAELTAYCQKQRERRDELQQVIQKSEHQIQFLTKMQQSYEGFGRGVKAVLTAQKPWREGVCGAVAELIKVPPEYVTAIEIALGGNLQNVVVEETDTAKAAIAFLKKERLGRVTFLPLSTITVREGGRDFSHETGFIGYASELVSCEAKYRPIADFLLNRTLVMDTLDNALALAKKQGQKLRLVTLEGELINPGGSLSGGSRGQREASFLNRQGEIDALTQEKQKATAELSDTAARYRENQGKLDETSDQLKGNAARLQTLTVKQAELKVALQRTTAAAENEKAAVKRLEAELTALKEAFAEIQAKHEALKRDVTAAEEALSTAKRESDEAYNALEDLEQDAEDLAKHINEREVNRAVLEQEILRSREHILLRTKEAQRQAAGLERSHEEEARLTQGAAADKERLKELAEKSALWQEKYDADSETRRKLYAEKMEKMAAGQELEKKGKETNRKLNAAQNKLHQLELAASKIQFNRDECTDDLMKEFGLTPEKAAAEALDLPAEQIGGRLRELKKQMEDIGPVNPTAVEEYEEQNQRRKFMQSQADDLVGAKENLMVIIAEMDEAMTKQFKAAFAEIQIYFGEIFVRLFGGGQAELRLLDENDVLNTGVEILVQLPQKKRQNLSALSGGERALTVIALLFSFLRYRPSPFSVLDEIDAPLDEANVVRFGAFLREFAENTQFIVVTHRKGTMESVDSMYGVTIEDAGVSKVLSVKIDDMRQSEVG